MSAELCLSWRGEILRVRGASSAALDWLRSFLCPPFTPAQGPAATTVDVVTGGPPIGWEATGGALECITLDEGPVSYPLGRAADGRAAARVERPAALVVPRDDGVELRLADDDRQSRVLVMRFVRELAGARALALGDLHLHASGVVTGDGATLFLGRKGAGKTTLMLHALAQPGTRLLGNDRVFVEITAGGAVARGMPTLVKLRPGTLELLPDLAARVRDARSPNDIAAALGAGVAAEAPVRRLVLVDPVRHDAPFTLTPLAGAAARLAAEALLAGGAQAAAFVRGHPPPLGERLAALTARVPCFLLAMGPGAYAQPHPW